MKGGSWERGEGILEGGSAGRGEGSSAGRGERVLGEREGCSGGRVNSWGKGEGILQEGSEE